MKNEYAVVYEPTANGWSAHVPDLPGFGAAAATLEECRDLVAEGVAFHLEGMALAGESIPASRSVVEMIAA